MQQRPRGLEFREPFGSAHPPELCTLSLDKRSYELACSIRNLTSKLSRCDRGGLIETSRAHSSHLADSRSAEFT